MSNRVGELNNLNIGNTTNHVDGFYYSDNSTAMNQNYNNQNKLGSNHQESVGYYSPEYNKAPRSAEFQERIRLMSEQALEKHREVFVSARENLPGKIKDKITPSSMLVEGIIKVISNVAVDCIDWGTMPFFIEWAIDWALGKATEAVTNRELRGSSEGISTIGSMPAEIAKYVKHNADYKALNRPKGIWNNVKYTFKNTPKNISVNANRKIDKTIRSIPWVGNMIPGISALVSPGAIDGLMDIAEALKAMITGQHLIEVSRIRPTLTSYNQSE